MSVKTKFAVLLSLQLALLLTLTTFAQGPEETPSADDVNRIAKNMYCPVCENTPLDVCETQACADWRDEIRLRLSEGWSDQQIYDYFVERHGDRVLAVPPARGLNWLIYVVPPLLLLGGVGLVYRTLRASLRRSAYDSAGDQAEPASSGSQPEDDRYAIRLEEELKKRL